MNARLSAQVAAATTAQLVAFFNAHAVKPVSKFADRKTAEKRVLALVADMVSQGGFCPCCNEITADRVGVDITYAGPEGTAAGRRNLCHGCGTEFNADGSVCKAAAASPNRSAAIASTWANADVAARRAARNGVRVRDPKGGEGNYRSVRDAFVQLGLPLGRHIKFRGQLKAAGKLDFAGHTFTVI